MRNRALAIPLLAALATSSTVHAQVVPGEFGFTVQSSIETAGSSCWGFNCTPQPLDVPRGDVLSLMIRAPLGQPYFIGLSLPPSLCISLSSWENSVVLNPQTLLVGPFGVIDRVNPISSFCWDGFTVTQLPVPPGVSTGWQVLMQAMTVVPSPGGPSRPAFSTAVLATIR